MFLRNTRLSFKTHLGRCSITFFAFFLTLVPSETPAQEAKELAAVKYGPHARNVMNVWLAKSEKPTPVIMMIHGGGWLNGNMHTTPPGGYAERGITVVSINYRLLGTDPLPAALYDAARALQFIRHKASEWNVDKTKIACWGSSAGAASSLWLGLHDDLADPKSKDPVEQESSKPTCVVGLKGQSAVDPVLIKEWVGPLVLNHGMIHRALGHKNVKDMMTDYEKNKEPYNDYSAFYHVDKEDAPLHLTYNRPAVVPAKKVGDAIHHPMFGIKLKEAADKAGLECHLTVVSPDLKLNAETSLHDFVKKHLGR